MILQINNNTENVDMSEIYKPACHMVYVNIVCTTSAFYPPEECFKEVYM